MARIVEQTGTQTYVEQGQDLLVCAGGPRELLPDKDKALQTGATYLREMAERMAAYSVDAKRKELGGYERGWQTLTQFAKFDGVLGRFLDGVAQDGARAKVPYSLKGRIDESTMGTAKGASRQETGAFLHSVATAVINFVGDEVTLTAFLTDLASKVPGVNVEQLKQQLQPTMREVAKELCDQVRIGEQNMKRGKYGPSFNEVVAELPETEGGHDRVVFAYLRRDGKIHHGVGVEAHEDMQFLLGRFADGIERRVGARQQ